MVGKKGPKNEVPVQDTSKHRVFYSTGGTDLHDSAGIGECITGIQGVFVQACNRFLKGWFIQGISIEGFLEKRAGSGDRAFVYGLVWEVKFTPFTKSTIDHAATVWEAAQPQLSPDTVQPGWVDGPDGGS